MSLARYLSQVSEAINSENANRDGNSMLCSLMMHIDHCVVGQVLCDLFRTDSEGLQVAMQRKNIPEGEVKRVLGAQWGEITHSYLVAMSHISDGRRVDGSDEFRERHAKGLQGLVSDQIWLLPTIIGCATTMRILAAQADDSRGGAGGGVSGSSQLSKCAMVLQSLFGKTAAAKGQDAERKRAAAVAIGCVMLKVYFRLNTLTNCKNVISTIEGPMRMFEVAQRAHKVTYRYYTGRLKAYDEDYLTAEQHLSFALANCHRDAVDNQRKILRYLIPVRMLLGILPTPALLLQHRLHEYADIAGAVRAGNVQQLLTALSTHQVSLVQTGTYLLLEKLQLAAYRRLFKKCALIYAQTNPGKGDKFPIDLFATAIQLQGIIKDDVEVQCLLSNLICRKFIKGYIAYKQRLVVLAKTDPFPAMKDVQLGDPFS